MRSGSVAGNPSYSAREISTGEVTPGSSPRLRVIALLAGSTCERLPPQITYVLPSNVTSTPASSASGAARPPPLRLPEIDVTTGFSPLRGRPAVSQTAHA